MRIWLVTGVAALAALALPAGAGAWVPGTEGPILFSSAEGAPSDAPGLHIWSVRPDGTGKRELTHGYDTWPSWAPDGRHFVFARPGCSTAQSSTTCSSPTAAGAPCASSRARACPAATIRATPIHVVARRRAHSVRAAERTHHGHLGHRPGWQQPPAGRGSGRLDRRPRPQLVTEQPQPALPDRGAARARRERFAR